MSVCCVFVCTNNYHNNRNVHYYRFPFYKERDRHERKVASLQQRMAWIRALKGYGAVTIENVHGKRICSAHFVSGKKADCMESASQSWAPTIGLSDYETNSNETVNHSTDKTDTIPKLSQSKSRKSNARTPIERETIEIQEIISSMEKCDEVMTQINEETAVYINKLRKVILAQARQIEELKTKLQEQG
ncbi:uncharacterized protein LOC119067712 [Bradysia coprophila]|uniref:uncharacterized protein LOC119067712 n=1 Tax=Bradysia coprophila TaxID=38358 RepID=UPI00187D9B1F|nr:uncharacterized protein LOC119067712 [Bradysia coprophila]